MTIEYMLFTVGVAALSISATLTFFPRVVTKTETVRVMVPTNNIVWPPGPDEMPMVVSDWKLTYWQRVGWQLRLLDRDGNQQVLTVKEWMPEKKP